MTVSSGGANKQTADQEAYGYLETPPPFDPSLIAPQLRRDEAPEFEEQGQVDPAEELERYKAQVAQFESEVRAERERREALESEQAERQAREAQVRLQQWQQAEAQAVEHAATLSHRDGLGYLRTFYAQREQALLGWGQETANEAQVLKWQREAEKIAKSEGLSDEDVDALVNAARTAGNPKVMKDEAQRIKNRAESSNREVKELREKLERMQAELNRDRLASSPVARVGQGGRASTPAGNYEKGSTAHLTALLGDLASR